MSGPNYQSKRLFTENLLTVEIRKTQIFINKPVYLGISIFELSKIEMYEFWYDYMQPQYEEK